MSNVASLKYENPLRPNFDAYSALTWGAATGLAYVGPGLTSMPHQPFYYAALVAGILTTWRARQAYVHYKRLKRLKGHGHTFITLADVKKKMTPDPVTKEQRVWIGTGFPWTAEHTQFAFELTKAGYTDQSGTKGARWIHGLNEAKEQDLYIPLKDMLGHTLIVGTTGSGKTRLFDILTSQDILRDEAVIVIDPKGDKELRDNLRKACEDAGQPERFVYFHPAFPKTSARIDPLRNYNRTTELASRLAALMPTEGQGDAFSAFAQKALDTVIQGMLMAGRKPNIRDILSILSGKIEELVCDACEAWLTINFNDWKMRTPHLRDRNDEHLDKHAAKLSKAYYKTYRAEVKSSELESLFNMFQHDRTHFSKMVASLLPVLNMLVSGTLGDLLSPDPHKEALTPTGDKPKNLQGQVVDTKDVIVNRKVLYIGLDSLSDSMVGSALGSLILSDLAAVAGDRYNFEDLDHSNDNNVKEDEKLPYSAVLEKKKSKDKLINIYVDEAAEVMNDPSIQMLNKGRGAKFKITIATQSLADFEARLGSIAKAEQVLGNINNVISLRLRCNKTKDFVTGDLTEVRTKYVMRTQASNTSAGGLEFTGNSGERLMEEEGELFQPALLGALPDLEFVANVSAGTFYKGRLPILKLGLAA